MTHRGNEAPLLSQLKETQRKEDFDTSSNHPYQATLQLTGTISLARYPGWCPFGRSNKSTSHSTTYRTPLGVLLVATMVPTLRSTIARGVLTHTLSPGLTFFIYSPPSEKAAHACTKFRVSSSFRRASPD